MIEVENCLSDLTWRASAMPTGRQLLNQLEVDAPVFGVAYSIINWSGLAKGVSISPSGITKLLGKLVEDGHATTFMIENGNITMTGMSDEGWVFYGGPLGRTNWARNTLNANTDVYYTKCTAEDVIKYKQIQDELENADNTQYHEVWPNIPGRTRYENCISSSHMIVHKMSFGTALATKGVWIPSISNWATWTATKMSAWKHKRFTHVNTHMP
ncbi:hypothetical protein [Microbulbifer sp. 2205BS26-8]|uniref:hypothetical protein n=1 Tax=Microbulbifer sp. 2205BS26-8 TaxID=3064386 RepID=UPI00273E49B5|nr:hypothetical protein [Microbulbifer sp. 2205BS26-8]MDP5211083.1 hypothetical protein [Microbulbifer sp. 2205BS26-8]